MFGDLLYICFQFLSVIIMIYFYVCVIAIFCYVAMMFVCYYALFLFLGALCTVALTTVFG